MADKISTSSIGGAISPANVVTSGSITAGTILVAFDDADGLDEVVGMLRKAEAQIVNYYARGKQ